MRGVRRHHSIGVTVAQEVAACLGKPVAICIEDGLTEGMLISALAT